MSKLVFIFGPQAVGKMTVGQELAKITGLKLFHNHMTIDLVANFYSLDNEEAWRLIHIFREEIFKSAAKNDVGLIFTFMCHFDENDLDYIDQSFSKHFREAGAEIYYVELECDFEIRRQRNEHPHRLACKPTKRNLEYTRKEMENSVNNHRLNSYDGELTYKNYMKIDNTNLPPETVAKMIKEKFDL